MSFKSAGRGACKPPTESLRIRLSSASVRAALLWRDRGCRLAELNVKRRSKNEMTGSPLSQRLKMAAEVAKTAAGTDTGAHPAPPWSPRELRAIDRWIAGQNDPALNRAEAIRRLVELGLRASKGKAAARSTAQDTPR